MFLGEWLSHCLALGHEYEVVRYAKRSCELRQVYGFPLSIVPQHNCGTYPSP